VDSITKGGLNSFIPPSVRKNRADTVVNMRLAQILRSEMPTFSIVIRFGLRGDEMLVAFTIISPSNVRPERR
jgi:hypothetical protein